MSYALITGAAKGIGRGIAHQLANRNYTLLLVDLDEDALLATARDIESTHPVKVYTLHQDLSAPDAIARIIKWTSPWHDDLNVVINNAGYGLNNAFETLTLDEQLNLIDVNIKAQVALSHNYIPILKKQPEAYLLNVSSTTAYQSVPYLTIYAASKSFVLSFTRGLRFELQHSRISVSCLIPGSTDTDFVNRAGMSTAVKEKAKRYNMQPEKVAAIAIKGLFNRKAEIIPGFTNRLHAFLPRFFPKIFTERIAGNIYRPAATTPVTADADPVVAAHSSIHHIRGEAEWQ